MKFMPKPKSKRTVLLQSSFSPTSLVGDFNLDMDASFDSAANVATVNIDEDTSTTGNESSEYQMSFALSSGAPIGVITLSFTGSGDAPAPGVSVAKTRAATETDPQATSGTVTPLANPDAFYERVWQQAVLDKKDELIDQVCGLDVRVKAATNYTVTQTVTSTAEALLVLTYAWKDASGTALISGTVKLAASSAALGGFDLGPVTVTDDSSRSSREPLSRGSDRLRARVESVTREHRGNRRGNRRDR